MLYLIADSTYISAFKLKTYHYKLFIDHSNDELENMTLREVTLGKLPRTEIPLATNC